MPASHGSPICPSYYRYQTVFLILYFSLHLQELGYTIVNDLLYGDQPEDINYRKDAFTVRLNKAAEKILENFNNKFVKSKENQRSSTDWGKSVYERFSKFPTCVHCEDPTLLRGVQGSIREEGYICLHSKRYKLGDLEFVSVKPEWINDKL